MGESNLAYFYFLSGLSMTDRAILVVLRRRGKKMAQGADVLIHIHVGAALNERIMAACTVQSLAPLHFFDMFKVVEGDPFKIDDVYRLRLVAEDAFLVLDTRLKRKLKCTGKVTEGGHDNR